MATGGADIGEATCHRLTADGATVVAVDVRSDDATVAIERRHADALGLAVDVDRESERRIRPDPR